MIFVGDGTLLGMIFVGNVSIDEEESTIVKSTMVKIDEEEEEKTGGGESPRTTWERRRGGKARGEGIWGWGNGTGRKKRKGERKGARKQKKSGLKGLSLYSVISLSVDHTYVRVLYQRFHILDCFCLVEYFRTYFITECIITSVYHLLESNY